MAVCILALLFQTACSAKRITESFWSPSLRSRSPAVGPSRPCKFTVRLRAADTKSERSRLRGAPCLRAVAVPAHRGAAGSMCGHGGFPGPSLRGRAGRPLQLLEQRNPRTASPQGKRTDSAPGLRRHVFNPMGRAELGRGAVRRNGKQRNAAAPSPLPADARTERPERSHGARRGDGPRLCPRPERPVGGGR